MIIDMLVSVLLDTDSGAIIFEMALLEAVMLIQRLMGCDKRQALEGLIVLAQRWLRDIPSPVAKTKPLQTACL